METFLYTVIVCVVVFICGLIVWFMIKNHQSDEIYENAIDEIYGRKR